MTRHQARGFDVRALIRWWPLIVLPALIAAAAAYWSVSHQSPSYTAATRLAVVPLAQWDETFLGTSLVRDSGDAHSTAATTAELLDSPEPVGRAITVSAVPDTNIVEVTARSASPHEAEQVSRTFVDDVLADRWRTIAAELDARIAALSVTTPADPNSGEASARLQTLTLIRQAGADPTLRIVATGAAVEEPRLPTVVILALAALGGAVVGTLCAFVAVRLRARAPAVAAPARPPDEPAPPTVLTTDAAG
ncbi:Chain length determinant protein [Mycolicibacterium rutilum]|uniref:Chain length determinant protein n=1 Tax=Mycolicibacterium rutilum TaxID=370526 RepID=A0A1H6IUZ3_MYCRU|nr:hypothetical protein [Mycolicibacterium rutilum]SEH50260.1 Chain length determinant protein [Mycolicibacterium rutilum]